MTKQLSLGLGPGPLNASVGSLRPIHYLGSKLRVVDEIVKLLDEVSPGTGRVCDLFSGSGVVSSALIYNRPVTAVDVQEYACLLAEASFLGGRDMTESLRVWSDRWKHEPLREALLQAFRPLLDLES